MFLLLPLLQVLGSQRWESNPGSHACRGSTLSTELCPQPLLRVVRQAVTHSVAKDELEIPIPLPPCLHLLSAGIIISLPEFLIYFFAFFFFLIFFLVGGEGRFVR